MRGALLLLPVAMLAAGCGATQQAAPTGSALPTLQIAEPPSHRPSLHNCLSHLAACGYPDAGGNDGAHGALTPASGIVHLTRPGQVYENIDLRGNIVVQANDVTIRNVRVTSAGQGVVIYSGNPRIPIDGTTIHDTTIRGLDRTAGGALGDGVLNAGGNTRTTGTRLYIYDSGSTDWNGPGAISDSYMSVDTYVSGHHDEAIFEPGGDDGVQATHDTLLNNQPQTADVFFSTGGGPGSHDSVTNSLLGGGGWMIYGANGKQDPPPVDGPRIANNRFVRCLTHSVFEPKSGTTRCSGGPDSHGYFPLGGSFGVAAALGSSTTWTGNYWDDTFAPAG
jgi:hypothetical protein